jgi:hypothetical protein
MLLTSVEFLPKLVKYGSVAIIIAIFFYAIYHFTFIYFISLNNDCSPDQNYEFKQFKEEPVYRFCN